MTTQIFMASTLYGAATLAAALDSDCFAPADRRVLLVSNNAANPETTPAPDAMPGFERLRERFDEVRSWNETIHPFHPGGWEPRPDDLALWERYLRLAWDLGDDDVELAVESIQVNPSLALTQIFTGVPVTVYADGLMSYGPTRNKIDPLVGTRITRLLHLDLVEGLRPLLLTEFGVEPEVVPTAAFTKVLGELSPTADTVPGLLGLSGLSGLPDTDGPALLLGQYLSALGILTRREEEELHLRMIRGAVALGHTRVVFKPHPAAPPDWTRSLEETAAELGAELLVVDVPVLAEVLYERTRPALVVGCFSTALFTAATFYGLPVARTGTATLLDRLNPYENSNRVPLTIVDALLPDLEDQDAVRAQRRGTSVEELSALLTAVGFVMQPRIHPSLRPAAERHLGGHLAKGGARLDEDTDRYFRRRRLTSLGLPGGLPSGLSSLSRNTTARRLVRRARRLHKVVRRRS